MGTRRRNVTPARHPVDSVLNGRRHIARHSSRLTPAPAPDLASRAPTRLRRTLRSACIRCDGSVALDDVGRDLTESRFEILITQIVEHALGDRDEVEILLARVGAEREARVARILRFEVSDEGVEDVVLEVGVEREQSEVERFEGEVRMFGRLYVDRTFSGGVVSPNPSGFPPDPFRLRRA